MAFGTIEDDRWALNNLRADGRFVLFGVSSYRAKDVHGIVHRAAWTGEKWFWLCEQKPQEKVEAGDPGTITCLRCLGHGA